MIIRCCTVIVMVIAERCIGSTVPIGLVIESSKQTEISAVSYAVEFANANILVNDNLTLLIKTFDENSELGSVQSSCAMAADGVVVQIGPTSTRHVSTVAPLLASLNVPLISPVGSSSPIWFKSNSNFTLHLRPPDMFRGKVIASIMNRMVWRRVHILSSDDHYGLFGLHSLLEASSSKGWFIVSSQSFQTNTTSPNVSAQLGSIKISGFRVIILNCKYTMAKLILDAAKSRNMTGRGWIWILTDEFTDPTNLVLTPPVIDYMQGLIAVGTQTTVGGLSTQFQAEWLGLSAGLYPGAGSVISTSVGRWVDAVFSVAYAVRDYGGNFTIPVGLNCKGTVTYGMGKAMMDELKLVNQPGIYQNIAFNETFPESFVFVIFNSRSTGWKKVATFSPSGGYVNIGVERIILPGDETSAPDTISVLNGRHLRAVTVKVEPFAFFLNGNAPADPNNIDPDKDQYVGMVIDLFNEMSRLLNFTYSIYMAPDGKYGGKNKVTGQWNGMKADIVCSIMAMARVRTEAIGFTRSWIDNGYNVAIPKEEKVVGSWQFMMVFGENIWVYIGLTILFIGLTIARLETISPYGYHGEFIQTHHDMDLANSTRRHRRLFLQHKKHALNLMNISNSIWFALASMIQQGYEVQPQALSSRIITIVAWFGVLVIISLYTAQLGAVLISARMVTQINSLEDMAAQDRIPYGTVAGSNMVNIFCNSDQALYKTICKNMQKQDTIQSAAVGKARALDPNDKFAYIHGSLVIDALIEKQPCKLRKLPYIFKTKGYGLGMPKDAPYNDILSETIQQLRDNGFLDASFNRWFKGRSECGAENRVLTDLEKNQMGFSDLKGVWIVMILAGMISPGIIAIECMYYCFEKSRRYFKFGINLGTGEVIGLLFSRMQTEFLTYFVPDGCKSSSSVYRIQHQREMKRDEKRKTAAMYL